MTGRDVLHRIAVRVDDREEGGCEELVFTLEGTVLDAEGTLSDHTIMILLLLIIIHHLDV